MYFLKNENLLSVYVFLTTEYTTHTHREYQTEIRLSAEIETTFPFLMKQRGYRGPLQQSFCNHF